MTRWLSCWCGQRGCAVHLPRLVPENSPVWPSLLFLLRSWGDDGTQWKKLVLLIPVCKVSYQTPHWNIADPWIRIWTVQIHLYVDSFHSISSQPSVFLGFASMDSINCRLKTVFSGDAEGWLYAYFMPFYIRGLSICKCWYPWWVLEPFPHRYWGMTASLGKNSIYRVQYYLQFQASTGGLKIYPQPIMGDYCIQIKILSQRKFPCVQTCHLFSGS